MSMICRRCGHCCGGSLLVEADVLDVMRDARIAKRGILLDGHGTLDPLDWNWSLTGPKACPFLKAANNGTYQCGIYPTRPGDCVTFLPGEARCAFPDGRDDESLCKEAIRAMVAEKRPQTEGARHGV